MSRDGVVGEEEEEEAAEFWLCAWAHESVHGDEMSERTALTHYLQPYTRASDSHGKCMTQGLIGICTWIHKYVRVHTQTHLFFIRDTQAHSHMRVCAHSCKTKLAVSYSQAVETDLTQCVHCLMRGGE